MATMQSRLSTTAYVLDHNKKRLLILFIVVGGAVGLYGIRGVFQGILDLIGQAPQLLVLLLFYSMIMIVQFGALMWFMSRPRTYTVTPDKPQIGLSFENYRGQPDLLEHAKSLVRILKGVKSFQDRGGEMPQGMLLAGPPGTGKTFLAGVMAAEANLPFIYIDASSLSSMFMGVDALIVMSLFRKARGLARKYAAPGQAGCCILFMDELDSVGLSRGGMAGGQQQGMMGGMGFMGGRGLALNTMLNQMDSLGKHVEDRLKHRIARWFGLIRGPVPPKPVVFVIGATNRPDVLDPALVRAGRLDRKLNVYKPDADGRRDIIQHYLRLKAHDPEIPIDLMVQDSIGWTPIDIRTIINEALIVAHDDGHEALSYKDWLTARDVRMHGIKQPILSMRPQDKKTIAYHEAGHAVVSHYGCMDDRIQKATIIRAGDAYGFVAPTPKEERHQLHADEIESDIMMSLGSRAVEELILHTKTANALGDLRQATSQAMAYVGMWGMGSTLMSFGADPMGAPPQFLALADRLLEQLYEETKRLIREKEYAVHAIAGALLQRGELIGPELDEIFDAADISNPEMAAPFVRKPVVLPKMSELAHEEKQPMLAALVPAASGKEPVPPTPPV
ncbi:MAG TPA: AAA family ATPase [Candidatus Limnocylindria bacterium]|jgi:cell division protease FtsH|nr:AAA family ATPase [Candidatus Limnocylindria bacterium]